MLEDYQKRCICNSVSLCVGFLRDEVRRVGHQLKMPERLIKRHPFPGPGLAVRILGDITREKVRILQDADDIYIEKMHGYNDARRNEPL